MLPTPRTADITALGTAFFEGLMDPAHEPLAAEEIAVVVAHPDDETIGCGALLGRLKGATLVMVTDGAPRNLADAHTYGFENAADYAAQRLSELRSALAIAGLPEAGLVTLSLPDQEAASDLAGLSRRIADICTERGISLLLTHTYEGGHPDHDAVAFACHAAVRLLAGRQKVTIVEMPFYRMNTVATVYQQFLSDGMSLQIAIPLTDGEKQRKARMLAAHQTQARVLEVFPVDVERFRPAPAYDFTELPNGGRLLYEMRDWGMTGERWQSLVRNALAELGFLP